jgi:REP element-mobilizing transposase RayT
VLGTVAVPKRLARKPGFAGLALLSRSSEQLGERSRRSRRMSSVPRLIQRHSHNLLLVHVVWATKRRAPLLSPNADSWVAQTLRRKAHEAGCRLIACGNAEDHVHVLLRYPSTVRVADAVHRLKGGSSYDWGTSRRSHREALPAEPWEAALDESAGENLAADSTFDRATKSDWPGRT